MRPGEQAAMEVVMTDEFKEARRRIAELKAATYIAELEAELLECYQHMIANCWMPCWVDQASWLPKARRRIAQLEKRQEE